MRKVVIDLKYEPINSKFPHFLHGADYNPEQWLDYPDVLKEDMRLMKLAKCNVMTVGVFSWASLEPEEGRFSFEWLDRVMDNLAANGAYAVLATPSGARPAWLSAKYPEVLRTDSKRVKAIHGGRHNHCFTSPIYREKTRLINEKLAERYKDHPALLVWHISNEYGGECHCELCQEAFREWLKTKYDNDLDKLNHAWWTRFWSHTYTDWSQIESPSEIGEKRIHGLNLDWKRFVTDQTIDFYRNEIEPIRRITPKVPVTTNFMRLYNGLDYWKFAPEVDVIAWDSYPAWHSGNTDAATGCEVSFSHDLFRSLKGGKPFILMESTPSTQNWQTVCKQKRPGMHFLSSIHAIAHGSDTVQYFQWRKSRGSYEKFHGAVVDHCGHENTRVFRDVAELGSALEKLDDIIGTSVKPEVALIFDWENRWAIQDVKGMHNERKDYEATCIKHYEAFWKKGVPVDIINMDCDFSGYRLLVAPMLYMLKSGVAERIEGFVRNGGTFITTYYTGMVDENDLCFLGGFPGKELRKVTGIWSEEFDTLFDNDINYIVLANGNELGLNKEYEVKYMCEYIHAETAKVLATYKDDYYAGKPALTVNNYGKGEAYYIAFRNNKDFEIDFYTSLINNKKLKRAIDAELPEGVTAQLRTDGKTDFVFLLNFSPETKTVIINEKTVFEDMLTAENVEKSICMQGYGVKILKRKLI